MHDQPTAVRFSLEGTPKPQRLETIKEVIGRAIMNMDFHPLTDDVEAEFELRFLPGVTISQGYVSPHRSDSGYDRSRENDDLVLIWADRPARGVIGQLGKTQESDGSAVLGACEEHTFCETREAFQHTTLRFQRSLLLPVLPNAETALMRLIPSGNEALRLLGAYIAGLRALSDTHSGSALAQMAATHITDLAALAVGTNRDAAQLASERGLRAARLEAVKRWTLARLGSPELSARTAAAAAGLSPRTVQLLFEAEGITFTGYVMRERLALAHRRLSLPQLARRAISDIAYDCGFGDLSYFTQNFRRVYGQTPSDVRRGTLVSRG